MGTISKRAAKFLLLLSILPTIAYVNLSQERNSFSKALSFSKAVDDEWKEFSSSEGGFRILFPKEPTKSSGTVNVGKMVVKTHIYSVRNKNTYEISYFDVPHRPNDPKVRADLLLGFRNFVIAELKGTLVSDSAFWLDDNEGRLLEISITKLGGIARVIIIVTDVRLYRVAVIPQKRSENSSTDVINSIDDRYLKSFKLIAIGRSEEGEVDAYLRKYPELAQRAFAADSGDSFLNGRALSLPAPEYPAQAQMVHAGGTIIVKVIIDETGNVVAAQAIGGHPTLQSSAEKAARRARFTPSLEQGRPTKVLGKVTYNFIWR